jgi:hypothetical protein
MNHDYSVDLAGLPQLYYAAAVAAHAHAAHIPNEYAATVQTRAEEVYRAFEGRIAAADLTALERATATTALRMLRDAPRERARLDIAAKAFVSVPARDAVLGEDSRRLRAENYATSTEHREAEASALGDLLRLLQ